MAVVFRERNHWFFFITVSPDPVSEITFFNITTTSLSLTVEFGFNGYGLLTELSVVYYTVSNEESYQNGTLTFTSNGTGPLPSVVMINDLQPYTIYQFMVMVSNEAGDSVPTDRNVSTLPLRKCFVVNSS